MIKKKSFGQHYLKNLTHKERIVGAISADTKTLWEIGPGDGALTDLLPPTTLLFELDQDLVEFHQNKGRTVFAGDFCQMDLPPLGPRPWSVVSNLPYNAATAILVRLVQLGADEMVLMFQKEVALKIVAKIPSKEVGRLTVFVQNFYEVKRLFTLSPGAFHPPPKVDSVVLKFIRRPKPMIPTLNEELLKALFAQPRKTIKGDFIPDSHRMRRPAELNWEDWELINEKFLAESSSHES